LNYVTVHVLHIICSDISIHLIRFCKRNICYWC